MTDVIPSLLDLHVYGVFEPRTFQGQFPLCPRIWKLFSCEISMQDQKTQEILSYVSCRLPHWIALQDQT